MPPSVFLPDMDGRRRVAVVVAHPDDEILWAGGLILMHPGWDWFIGAACRASDGDRAPRFRQVLERLGASGRHGDLDDGPAQDPRPDGEVQAVVAGLLPAGRFDLVVTHGPRGEYTRHRRHEEVCRAVVALWAAGRLAADKVCMFAYEDGGRAYLPRAVAGAHVQLPLSVDVWQRKHRLVTGEYGFAAESWEARVTPRVEAFWCFDTVAAAERWLQQEGSER